MLETLSRILSIPIDQISAAFCLILSFPFAFLLHFFLFSTPKFWGKRRILNFLSIGPTYLFLWICFYLARREGDEKLSGFVWDLISIHLPILFTFFSLKYSNFIKRNPTILFASLLLQLSYHHLSRQLHFYNQYTVNITGPLMILIIKLSAFAYNVSENKISINSIGFESFYTWSLLFAGFFTGPVVHHQEFEEFYCDPRGYMKLDDKTRGRSGRKRRSMFLILSASLLLILGILLQPHFPTTSLIPFSESLTIPLFLKLSFMHLALLTWRLKYYVAWLLAEGAIVIIGFGFVLKDGKVKW